MSRPYGESNWVGLALSQGDKPRLRERLWVPEVGSRGDIRTLASMTSRLDYENPTAV